MNISEHFIRRPVMTVLLNLAIVMAGVIGFRSIPVAALPSYDTPVINVSASLAGASPETMATSVALPLEKQFQTVPGLKTISSTSTLGSTSLTLEFEESRNIDAAAVDVQAAVLRAQRGAELGDVGDEATEPGGAEVAQPPVGGAPVATVVDRVDHEAGRVERPGKAVVAFAVFGQPVGDLHHAGGRAGHVGPGVGHDRGAVGVRDEGGGRGGHRTILTPHTLRPT